MYQRTSHHHGTSERERRSRRWQLLVESPDPALAISDFTAFRQAGFDITLCGGPLADANECPLVNGEPCPLATEADVVLFDLGGDPDDAARRSRRVLDALRAFRPDLPIVVRSATAQPGTADAETIGPATSVAGQVEALCRAALNSARDER